MRKEKIDRSFTVGNYHFTSRAKAKELIREIINKTPLDQELPELEFWLDLFKNHPSYREKAGNGIATVCVRLSPYGDRMLVVKRIDGSEIDISWMECLYTTNKLAMLKSAFRKAVDLQTIAFKESTNLTCALGGEALTLDTAHVDHWPTYFHKIFSDFIAERKLREADYPVERGGGIRHIGPILKDVKLEMDWLQYHAKRASYRILCIKANTSGWCHE